MCLRKKVVLEGTFDAPITQFGQIIQQASQPHFFDLSHKMTRCVKLLLFRAAREGESILSVGLSLPYYDSTSKEKILPLQSVCRDNMNLINNGKKKPETYMVCSMLKGKDSLGFFRYLSGCVDFAVAVPIESESGIEKPTIIAKNANISGIKAIYSNDFEQAFDYIKAIHGNPSKSKNFINKIIPKRTNKNPARVIICGSLYLAGEFLKENSA